MEGVNQRHAKTSETACTRGFGETDREAGGDDGVERVGQIISIYPYVPKNSGPDPHFVFLTTFQTLFLFAPTSPPVSFVGQ